jgi:hypothetical protein
MTDIPTLLDEGLGALVEAIIFRANFELEALLRFHEKGCINIGLPLSREFLTGVVLGLAEHALEVGCPREEIIPAKLELLVLIAHLDSIPQARELLGSKLLEELTEKFSVDDDTEGELFLSAPEFILK